jgi:hypothetical protein
MPMFGLAQPRTTKGQAWIRRRLAALREGIESALEASKGPNASALVFRAQAQSAVRHELRAALCLHFLSTEPDLSVADRTTLLAAICKATDSRDRVLLALGIEPEAAGGFLASLQATVTEIDQDDAPEGLEAADVD